jgi:hypothetical protein
VEGFNPFQFRRLAILDPQNRTEFAEAGGIVRDCLAAELQGTGRFEVLSPLGLPSQATCTTSPIDDPAVLAAVMERYHPDAIVLCTVSEFRPYAPMRLGLSLRVISAIDAMTLAAVDSSWESPLNDDEGRPSGNPVLSDLPYAPPELALYAHSPREFVRAVAREIAVGLAVAPPMLPPSAVDVSRPVAPPALPAPLATPPAPVTESGSSTPPASHL